MNSLGVFAIGLAALVVMSAPAQGGAPPTRPPPLLPPGTLPPMDDCGIPDLQGNSRVINGQDAKKSSWPWQILMLKNRRPWCGGTIISNHWVVTAAHCVDGSENSPRSFKVRVGEHDRNQTEGTEVDHEVERIVKHSQYDNRIMNNDIALFKLAKPVMFNKHVKPACLPNAPFPAGTECYLTGWGKMKHSGNMHRVLKQTSVQIHETAACEQSLRDAKINIPYQQTSMVCAGGQGKGGCHGDSGGPLVCKHDGKWELAGAVSFGDSKCTTNFAKITYFKSWILDMMKSQPPSAPPGTLPPMDDCGIPDLQANSRVINGQDAKKSSWPWQILMLKNGRAGCGGTIISNQWVVTAAHCVHGSEDSPRSFQVRVGEHDRSTNEGTEVDHEVKRVVQHPQYNKRSLNNDIALFQQAKPVMYNKYVKPACLPSSLYRAGTECYLTGWGKMKHPGRMVRFLQQGRVEIRDTEACKQSLLDAEIPVPYTTSMVCAGGQGTGGCHGDTGGPLVCQQNGKWELAGAVSFGDSECTVDKFTTNFARISNFKQWILDRVNAN